MNFEKYFGNSKTSNLVSDKELMDLENQLKTKLPNDFKEFLKQINGFEGFLGQSYARLVSAKEIPKFTNDYCSEVYPGKICIGTNGSGEIFVIDKQRKYGVAPVIGDGEDYIELGDTLDKFLERLRIGTFLQ